MFDCVITLQDLKMYPNFEAVISLELRKLGVSDDDIEVSVILLLGNLE